MIRKDSKPVIDKSKWGEGPWQTEPDRVEFKAHGFPCLLNRTEMGNWCGYVAIPPGHPAFEKSYDDVDVSVHGGLTYADHCHGQICHVPAPGEPDNVWWLGFDCAHGADIIPSFNAIPGVTVMSSASPFGETYKDLEYVRHETENLAKQLSRVGSLNGR
jgi:hypothetical protein